MYYLKKVFILRLVLSQASGYFPVWTEIMVLTLSGKKIKIRVLKSFEDLHLDVKKLSTICYKKS